MLVLSRKKNESIVINNDVVITVVEIRGDKVRLGIVAPKEVPVHREEVYEQIHGTKTNRSSSIMTSSSPWWKSAGTRFGSASWPRRKCPSTAKRCTSKFTE